MNEECIEFASVFDARGNGRGGISPTITGDHQSRISDYTAIVVIEYKKTDAKQTNND